MTFFAAWVGEIFDAFVLNYIITLREAWSSIYSLSGDSFNTNIGVPVCKLTSHRKKSTLINYQFTITVKYESKGGPSTLLLVCLSVSATLKKRVDTFS